MRHPLLTLAAVGALLAPLTLRAPVALAATPAVGVASESTARVIVKFKTDAQVLRRQAQSATGPAASAQVLADRAQSLGQRTGLALKSGAAVSDRMQVVFAKGMSSAQLASRLAKEADVEYAVVDQRRRRFAAPNDPLYPAVPGSGPASGQWYLKPPSVATPSGIDAEGAWDITTGTSSVVVAVLDTGVRFDHPDLAGKLHAGYDFISDVPTANDGNGRDADASDPGDWVTQAEADQPGGAFEDCEVENSSWHGTQVAGIVGAATNNGIGMASVGRNVMVLPVRVLGKCGGYDSDIVAGMRWAAGLSVDDVPPNPHPARVINMSLGGDGVCAGPLYPGAIAEINAAGVVVVASAGNSAGHAVAIPANCAGVIGVGGLRHVGAKVGFSDLGPQITVSAPGGNCVNIGLNDACLFPILTTSNAGVTAPVAGGIYSDSFNISVGTSFSAPLVAGTAALMFSANPALTPRNVELLLASTARPFPTTGGDNGDGTPVLECTAPQFDSGSAAVDQLQCYCSTGTCGGGMLDARAAVQAASTGVAAGVRARIDIVPQQPVALQTIQLRGGNSVLAAGRSISTYQWALVDGGGIVDSISNATAAVATVVPTAAGRFKVRLTVVDSANAMSTADLTMVVNPDPTPPAPPPPPAPSTGGGGGGALGFEWLALLAAAVWTLRRSGRAAA